MNFRQERDIRSREKMNDNTNDTITCISNNEIANSILQTDKDVINSILKDQIRLLKKFQDPKRMTTTSSKKNYVSNDVKTKIETIKENAMAYSSEETNLLLGLFSNNEYFFSELKRFNSTCEKDEEKLSDDELKYAILVLGMLLLTSMRRDINPTITPNAKFIMLNFINDYDMEKDKLFKKIFSAIKNAFNITSMIYD